MSTSEGKGSPAKGKASDHARWRANWWDVHTLVEDVCRPVVWSSSSTIFTAHPTQPIVIGRLFPSSIQFVVASPDPVLRSPASYAPPTVISVSPDDMWLFAFFPSHESESIACLWNRGPCIDAWMVKQCWSFSRGAGVITCAWAGTDREWSTSVDGSSCRLPLLGPLTPVSNPTLMLVTQIHQLHVCYLHTYAVPLRMLLCSLTYPQLTTEGQQLGAMHDNQAGPNDSRLCIYAAIGFIYEESSILVAMRSRKYPSSDNLKPAACNDLGLGIPLGIPDSQDTSPEEQVPSLEWGALAEEQTIELCEVKLRFDGMHTSLISQPLPPLHYPSPHLNGLIFVSSPPAKIDPSASPRTSPKRDKQQIPPTFLVASFLNFEDYNIIPNSSVVAYALARVSPVSIKTAWVGERSFSPRVLTLSYPGWVSTDPRKRGLIALLADTSGSVSRRSRKAREVAVGNVLVLRLPELTDDPEWEKLPIITPLSRAGMDWPVNIAVSKNQVLFCAMTLCRMSIHTLPRQLLNVSASGDSIPRTISPISVALVTALQSRRSMADVAHALAAPAVVLDTIVDAINGTWLAFETNLRAGLVGAFSVLDVLGATVELYRARARVLADSDAKDSMSLLWKNAHDMCSMIACFAAFEDCKEPEGYDLEAIWQLVSLSGWTISFLEKLMKECLSASDLTDPTPNMDQIELKSEPVDDTDVFALEENKQPSLSSPLDSPILLHIVHPFILTNLIGVIRHVNRFYHSLSVLTPKGESSQIARDILLDVIACSGFDLEGIEEILKSTMSDVRNIPGDEARLSLSKCYPVPAQHPFLRKVVHTLYTSTAVNKSRLFMNAADLIDGFARLPPFEQPGKEQERDVVTKGVLTRRKGLLCLRCGYRSEIGGEVSVAGHTSARWRTWEKMWASRCICGGMWINGDV